jgi:hypothetical protein
VEDHECSRRVAMPKLHHHRPHLSLSFPLSVCYIRLPLQHAKLNTSEVELNILGERDLEKDFELPVSKPPLARTRLQHLQVVVICEE